MNLRVLGIYRESEFSPGKVSADRAIMDAVLAQLRATRIETVALDADALLSPTAAGAHLVLAMCQGPTALKQLAALEEAGAIVINSALAIRNCYRDLLGAGLSSAGVPTPDGALVQTAEPLDLQPLRMLDLAAPLYVKRGDLHALGPEDVCRVEGLAQLRTILGNFRRRGITRAYVQQESLGTVVKFYGVGAGDDYFATLAPEGEELPEGVQLQLTRAAGTAARALGLQVWGGDAVIQDGQFSIIDFNDWPSFEQVRQKAAGAIARQALLSLRRHPAAGDLTL